MNFLGFFQKRRINTILCGRCQKDDCYDCNRFNFIRTIRKKCFEKQIGPKNHEPWPHQPVLWQVFDDFNKKPNQVDKNTYRFRSFIEKSFIKFFSKKKKDFINDKIIE